MKLLVISAAFPPMCAGEADHAFQLCSRLAEQGLDIHILTTKGNIKPVNAPFSVHPIMRDWSWSDLPRFIKFLKRCSPEAVVLIYIGSIYNEHPMITFSPTISKAILPSAIFVTQFESFYGANPPCTTLLARIVRKSLALGLGPRRVDYYFGTLLYDSDRIITLCDYHLAELSKLSSGLEKKAVVIPAPPLIRILREERETLRKQGRELLKVQPNDYVLVYFGRIYPDKGVDVLLQAFQLVASRRRDVHLVLVGGYVDNQYPAWASFARKVSQLPNELGIADKVSWTGEYAWDSELPSLYLHASDICVLPYRFGVQSNNSTFSAAASHGLPIVTTQGEMLDSFFVHLENVYLCPPQKPEALAMAIETLLTRSDLRERLSIGTLKLAQEWFSWEQVIERTMKVLFNETDWHAEHN